MKDRPGFVAQTGLELCQEEIRRHDIPITRAKIEQGTFTQDGSLSGFNKTTILGTVNESESTIGPWGFSSNSSMSPNLLAT